MFSNCAFSGIHSVVHAARVLVQKIFVFGLPTDLINKENEGKLSQGNSVAPFHHIKVAERSRYLDRCCTLQIWSLNLGFPWAHSNTSFNLPPAPPQASAPPLTLTASIRAAPDPDPRPHPQLLPSHRPLARPRGD